jgi:glycolate oxidase iron-sulfur subunit
VIEAINGLDPCVHCGFCLQSCPTYVATGDEADSPRGRIVLMQRLARGDLPPADRELAQHIDRCLGCLGCESACPSGVEYGPALEHTRSVLQKTRAAPFLARLVLAVMAEPRVRRPLLGAGRLLRPVARRLAGKSRFGLLLGMLGATRLPVTPTAPPSHRRRTQDGPPGGEAAPLAAVFRGCIMDDLFSHVHGATERTLRANSVRVLTVRHQGCCGALHAHAGLLEQAKELARRNIAAFRSQPHATVVVNAAGCGATLKEYGRLLRNDPLASEAAGFSDRVKDVSEVLASCGPRSGGPLGLTVAVDPPCHLQHAQHVGDAPAAVLRAIPAVEYRHPADADHCCGSAGVYSILEPQLSQLVLARKLDSLRATGADVIASANPGCIMQIGAGLLASGAGRPVVHPIELLDASYRRAGYYADGSEP